MRLNQSKIAQIFFNPETLLPFFFGSVFLAVLGNAVTQILFKTFGDSAQAAAGIAVGAVLIFVGSILLFARALERQVKVEPNPRSPQKHRGLILLVSRQVPCQTAIHYHKPQLEYCWLLHSAQTEPDAKALRQEFTDQGIQFATTQVNDINDPLEYYRYIQKIYANLPAGLSPQAVIADYTGMTAHGSVGMVFASRIHQSPLQYTPVNPTNPKASLAPIEIVLQAKRN